MTAQEITDRISVLNDTLRTLADESNTLNGDQRESLSNLTFNALAKILYIAG